MVKTKCRVNQVFIIVSLLFVGLALRITDLGDKDFWFDEAGVAYAAASENIIDVIQAAHHHAAAMPLDYVVAFGMAKISLHEGWFVLGA